MADVKIEVRENGPNRVTGPIEIVDASGANYTVPEGAGSACAAAGCLRRSLSVTAPTATVDSWRIRRPGNCRPFTI